MHRQDEPGRLAEMQAQTLEALSRYTDRILTDPAEMMAEAILLVRLSRCFPARWALLNAAGRHFGAVEIARSRILPCKGNGNAPLY